MGIYLSVLALSEADGEAVTAYPPLMAPLIGMDGWSDPDGPAYRRCQRNYHAAGGRDPRGLMSRIMGTPLENFWTRKPRYLDLDKAWHAAHWLFTRQRYAQVLPHGFLLASALEPDAATVAAFKHWRRPARVFTTQQTRLVSMWLTATEDETIAARYNPRAMARARIYPDIIWERDGQDALDYVMHYVRELRTFVRETADRGEVLAVY